MTSISPSVDTAPLLPGRKPKPIQSTILYVVAICLITAAADRLLRGFGTSNIDTVERLLIAIKIMKTFSFAVILIESVRTLFDLVRCRAPITYGHLAIHTVNVLFIGVLVLLYLTLAIVEALYGHQIFGKWSILDHKLTYFVIDALPLIPVVVFLLANILLVRKLLRDSDDNKDIKSIVTFLRYFIYLVDLPIVITISLIFAMAWYFDAYSNTKTSLFVGGAVAFLVFLAIITGGAVQYILLPSTPAAQSRYLLLVMRLWQWLRSRPTVAIAVLAACVLSGGLAVWRTVFEKTNRTVEIIHTVSYSNSAVFLLGADNKARVKLHLVIDPTKHIDALLAEQSGPIVAVTPFSNALIAMSRNPELVIIAGSGLNGLSLLSNSGPHLDNLIDRRIGTSRGDTLELFGYEAMTYYQTARPRPFKFVYFTDPVALVLAAQSRQVEGATHVEPFASALVDGGLARVLTSAQLWGDHPDAVVVTTRGIIKAYSADLRWLIRELIHEKNIILSDQERAADKLAPFYKLTGAQLRKILSFQRPEIDIRRFEEFFVARLKTLKQLNYVDSVPTNSQLFDWEFLEGT